MKDKQKPNHAFARSRSNAGLGRGERRLEIARKLTKLLDGADVMKRIEVMPPEEREHLRGLVDWVEEYENHETT